MAPRCLNSLNSKSAEGSSHTFVFVYVTPGSRCDAMRQPCTSHAGETMLQRDRQIRWLICDMTCFNPTSRIVQVSCSRSSLEDHVTSSCYRRYLETHWWFDHDIPELPTPGAGRAAHSKVNPAPRAFLLFSHLAGLA